MPIPSPDSFAQLALVLLACAIAGAIGIRLRQPLLVAYVAVGIAAGPAGAGLVQAHGVLETFAQLGVTILLFIVGLKLDLQHVRHIGPVAVATGLGQLGFTTAFGFVITLALGRDWLEALYIAVALTFSSTIIVVKLLSDKRELDSLHGRIAVGFLVVQDLALVFAMMAMSAFQGEEGAGAGSVVLSIGLRLATIALLTLAMMRFGLPRLLGSMARSQELLLLFAVSWGVALAALGEYAGFSKEAGAFLAGFTLASTPYRDQIGARLGALRDFLLLFFFLQLGAGLDLSTLWAQVAPAAILSVFVLIGNPLIVMGIMGYMGYRKRTGFLAGLTVAQISEFSIIFVAMGITMGHVDQQTLGLVTLVGIVTITGSTYMILYSHPLYDRLAPWLRPFERRTPFRELAVDTYTGDPDPPEVLVFGLGRYGRRVVDRLSAAGIHVLGVDFDPELVGSLQQAGLTSRFGDAEDLEFVETLPIQMARCALFTFPERRTTRTAVEVLRAAGFTGPISIADRGLDSEDDLSWADRVFRPFIDAADHAADGILHELRPDIR